MSRRVIPEFIENPHKLSAEEFTRKMCIWFEDQGLMSEVRTHLRSLMITSLKGTPLGPKSFNVGSPKCQAINLMIAEYLVEQQFHYTLSVFSSEVPLKDFSSLTVTNLAARKESFADAEPHPRYKECFVKDILESIGFSPQSEESNKITSFYKDSEEGLSLIACVFRIVSELLLKRQDCQKVVNGRKNIIPNSPMRDTDDLELKSETNLNFEGIEDIFNSEMQGIISSSALKTEHLVQLHNEIKKCIHLQVSRVQQEEESKYKQELLKREKNIQENFVLRETFFQQLLEDSNARIENERQDMMKGRQEMKDLAGQLRARHSQLVARCTDLEDWGQSLKSKEIQIEEMKHQEALRATEKTCQLDLRKHQLHLEFERLQKDHEELDSLRNSVIELKRSLENAHQNIAKEAPSIYNLQEECIYLRKELDSARNLLKKKTSTTTEKEIQQIDTDEKHVGKSLLQQMLVTKELSRQLQQENGELRARTRQQDRRIEELTTRAADLVTQLEDAKTALIQLSHQGPQFPSSFGDHIGIERAIDSVPIPSQSADYQKVQEQHRILCAGDESPWEKSLDVTGIHSTQVSKSVQTKEVRKKLLRRLPVHKQVSSDESSPTDDILVEAKKRLRSLEEESETVDRKFREFRERHSMHCNASQYVLSSHLYNTASNIKTSHQPSVYRLGKSSPSHSKMNSRTVFYQEPEVYAQSRFGRMKDQQTYSSSETENSFIISQTSPVSSRRPNRNTTADRLVKNSSPSPVETRYNMQSELQSPQLSLKRTSPPLSLKRTSQDKNVESAQSKLNPLTQSPSPRHHPPTKDANLNLKLTSDFNTPQVLDSVEVPQSSDTNAVVSAKLIAGIDSVDHSPSANTRPEKDGKKSPIAFEKQEPKGLDAKDSMLVYMNATPTRHSSDSEENPPPLLNLPQNVANTSKTIADIARENSARVQTQPLAGITPPLEYPGSRLERLKLESKNTVLFTSTVQDSNAHPSTKTLEELKKKKSTTALSRTTSGSGFESSLPALQNISLSSIELSSDHAPSDINSKDRGSNSEEDFWA